MFSHKDSVAVSVEGKLTDDSGSVGRWRPVASHLQHKVFNLNSTSSFNFDSLLQVIADDLAGFRKFACLYLYWVRGILPACISSCGLRNPVYCHYTGNFTIQAALPYRQRCYTDGIVK